MYDDAELPRRRAEDAAHVRRVAERLGVDRSELLREALRLHLVRLAAEDDVAAWVAFPPDDDERALDGRSPTGGLRKTGRTGPMRRGEIWFAATPGGDRPVLILTRDPVAERIGSIVVAALTRTVRGLVSELELAPDSAYRQQL